MIEVVFSGSKKKRSARELHLVLLEEGARWRRDGQLAWQKWLSVPQIALNIGYERRAIETVFVMEDSLCCFLFWTDFTRKGKRS